MAEDRKLTELNRKRTLGESDKTYLVSNGVSYYMTGGDLKSEITKDGVAWGTISGNIDSQTDLKDKFDDVGEDIGDVVSGLATANQRIDTILANPGSTSGDLELLDTHVGVHGQTYGSAGDAIRANAEQLYDMKTGFDGVVYPSPAAMVQGCDTILANRITAQKTDIDQQTITVDKNIENGQGTANIPAANFVNKIISSSTGQEVDDRADVCSSPYVYIPINSRLTYSLASGYTFQNVFYYDENYTFLGTTHKWYYKARYARFGIKKSDSSNISPSEAKAALTVGFKYRGYISRKTFGKNLFDKTNVEAAYILNNEDSMMDSTTYSTSDIIPISAGQSITISPSIRYFLAFDASGEPISASFVSTLTDNYTFTATVDGYVRFSIHNNNLDSTQAEYGSTPTRYEAFKYIPESKMGMNAQMLADVEDALSEELSLVNTAFVENDNLLYGLTMKTGKYWRDGSEQSSASYNLFMNVPVESGKSYVVAPNCRMYSIVSTYNGSYILESNNNGPIAGPITPSHTGYMHITFYAGDSAASLAVYESGKTNVFPYTQIALSDNVVVESSKDVLYNKKWAVCGDSFTAGSESGTIVGGLYDGKPKVYPYFIGNRTSINVLQFFQSGKTLAFPATPGDFTNSLTNPSSAMYYQNIPADVDYITIYLGINDEHHSTGGGDGEDPTGVINLGTIDDNTTATYYGAWNVVLSWLLQNRPFAHIGMIVTNGLSISTWYEAQINIAKKYGIPYIDLNGDSRTPTMIRSMNPNVASAVKTLINQKQAVDYPENMHPNDDAHEFESTFIEAFLRSI